MDVLIKWEDGTENVVAIKELSLIDGSNRFEKYKKLKMDYGGKLYYGIIVATENDDDSDAQYNNSDDNSQEEVGLSKSPLSECGSDNTNKELETNFRKINKRSPKANEAANLGKEDSKEKLCEHPNCSFEIYSACICLKVLLCFEHFEANNNCRSHQDYNPESLFRVEGSPREVSFKKVRKINSYKLAKEVKNKGQRYVRPKTMNLMPPKQLGLRRNGESCSKRNKKCSLFSDGKRQEIMQDFYSMGSLQLQREYIERYIKMEEIKQKTTQKGVSRKNKSNYYFLLLDDDELPVYIRERDTKATQEHWAIVVNFFETYPQLLKRTFANQAEDNAELRGLWETLTSQLNSTGHGMKSVAKWQQKTGKANRKMDKAMEVPPSPPPLAQIASTSSSSTATKRKTGVEEMIHRKKLKCTQTEKTKRFVSINRMHAEQLEIIKQIDNKVGVMSSAIVEIKDDFKRFVNHMIEKNL
ncbi:unnamed protein product [Psylliodes chrysocephalus]|uniref:Uncharacterized protein n=1 Tax=Psylliodes chrysocephalus TaxID=3402493 RepID=A0A9P0G9Y5_9CUCU|nr:unnamed protein product [Psylliodes chrysocephala]